MKTFNDKLSIDIVENKILMLFKDVSNTTFDFYFTFNKEKGHCFNNVYKLSFGQDKTIQYFIWDGEKFLNYDYSFKFIFK